MNYDMIYLLTAIG